MIDRFERFSFSILEVNRCWHRITSEAMRKHGLKGSYSIYFSVIYRYPQGITATRLGEICGRDKADISRAITAMEEKGLLVRGTADGRVYRALLRLTEEGRELAESIHCQAQSAVEFASQGLPAEKRQTFYEALELIASRLQILSRDGIPEDFEG